MPVLLRNNRLALDVPGQMAYESYPPDEDGRHVFRVSPTMSVVFNQDDDGAIESLSFTQREKTYDLPRTGDLPESEVLPTMDDVLALRDLDAVDAAFQAWGLWRLYTLMAGADAGVEGHAQWTMHGEHRLRQFESFGSFGTANTVMDGTRGFTASSFEPAHELLNREVDALEQNTPEIFMGDWRDGFDRFTVLETSLVGASPVWWFGSRTTAHPTSPSRSIAPPVASW